MDGREVMLITNEGIIIRIGVDDISQLGRVTSGVKLMNLDNTKDIRVASIAKVREDEHKEELGEDTDDAGDAENKDGKNENDSDE